MRTAPLRTSRQAPRAAGASLESRSSRVGSISSLEFLDYLVGLGEISSEEVSPRTVCDGVMAMDRGTPRGIRGDLTLGPAGISPRRTWWRGARGSVGGPTDRR